MPNEITVIERQLDLMRPLFEQVLKPTGLTAERMVRTVVISCERNPALLQCTPVSIMQSAMTGAVLGLEADGVTGQGFLIPFKGKAAWITGYKGYSTLGWRAGLTIDGNVMREGDEFDYELGSSPFVRHKPLLGGEASRRIMGAWATATAPGRSPIPVVMSIDEIEQIKNKAPGARKADSPWNQPGIPFAAMCAKTARRRLARSLPLCSFVAAARIDEAHEEQDKHAFLNERSEIVIDGEALALGEAEPDTRGPGVAALQRPVFRIRRSDGSFDELPTIEQWRASMVDIIEHRVRSDLLPSFWEQQSDIVDDLNDRHHDAVQAVAAVYNRRMGQAA